MNNTMGESSKTNAVMGRFQFKKRDLHVISYNGSPHWLLPEVEAAMGYSPYGLAALVHRDWSKEFKKSQDILKVSGPELRDLRETLSFALENHTSAKRISPKTRHIYLLTRPGLHKVCLVSNKPAARELRDWLATKVLPEIEDTGKFEDRERVERAAVAHFDPLTMATLNLQTMQSLLTQAKKTDATVREHDQRLGRVEGLIAADRLHGHGFSVVAWGRLMGHRFSRGQATYHGRSLARLARKQNVALGTVTHPVWGRVREYPIDLLQQYFAPPRWPYVSEVSLAGGVQ